MPMPLTRTQIEDELKRQYGFTPEDGKKIIRWLVGSGNIRFHGPMVTIVDPSSHAAKHIASLFRGAMGRSMDFGRNRIKEFLNWVVNSPMPHGSSHAI
ncbi:MAG: hypothetical protein KKB50_01195 [Planctomycetes bacterium]|nr:hypothetical protein [Planctomycetota bacterium]